MYDKLLVEKEKRRRVIKKRKLDDEYLEEEKVPFPRAKRIKLHDDKEEYNE